MDYYLYQIYSFLIFDTCRFLAAVGESYFFINFYPFPPFYSNFDFFTFFFSPLITWPPLLFDHHSLFSPFLYFSSTLPLPPIFSIFLTTQLRFLFHHPFKESTANQSTFSPEFIFFISQDSISFISIKLLNIYKPFRKAHTTSGFNTNHRKVGLN